MTVPVFVLKNGRPQAFSRQRNVIVGCLQPFCTLNDPHLGQYTPSGQRFRMNHCSAFASVEYVLMNCVREMPLRNALPGAFVSLAMNLSYRRVTGMSRGFRRKVFEISSLSR